MLSELAIWAGAIAAFLGGMWAYGSNKKREGKRQERANRKEADAKAAMEAQMRMDHADISSDDPIADQHWLRERAKRDGGS